MSRIIEDLPPAALNQPLLHPPQNLQIPKNNPQPVKKSSSNSRSHNGHRLRTTSCTSSPTDSDTSSSSSSSSDSDSDVSIISLPPALDGGWGWVIVAGSFFAHFICDGMGYNAGLIYDELNHSFEGSRSYTSLVSSVFLAVPYIIGPIAGALTNRYGCRKITIFGAILGAIGCWLSFFATSIWTLSITFGVISGVGQAFAIMASTVIVPYYFEKRRSFAYGLAVSGSGIGTAALAPIIQYMQNIYGWQGMFLVMGSIVLNLAVCGSLYRSLVTREYKRKYKSRKNLLKFDKVAERQNSQVETDMITPKVTHSAALAHTLQPAHSALDLSLCALQTVNSCNSSETQLQVPTPPLHPRPIAYNSSPADLNATSPLPEPRRRRRQHRTKNVRYIMVSEGKAIAPLAREDIFYRSSVMADSRGRSYSCPNLDRDLTGRRSRWTDRFRDFFYGVLATCKQMGDVKLLANPIFGVFWIANFLFYVWFEIPLTFIVEYAEKGPELASSLSQWYIVVFGIVNTIGQISLGWLGDRPWCNIVYLFAGGIIGTGVITLFLPLFTTFSGLLCYCAIFILFSCGNTALDTLILAQLLGMKRLTNSYGLLMVGQGLASLVGPPFGGFIIDNFGFHTLWYTTGAGLIFTGVFSLLVLPLHRRKCRRWSCKKSCCRSDSSSSSSSEDEDLLREPPRDGLTNGRTMGDVAGGEDSPKPRSVSFQ